MSLGLRDGANRSGHGLVGHCQEPKRDLIRREILSSLLVDLIRKFLQRDYWSKPSCQYNAIMLLRILADNPGPGFTRFMDKKFVDWLMYACELYTACVQQESTTQEEPLSKEVCLAAENTYLDYQKSTDDEARKTKELLGKQIATTSDLFRRISDEFPTGSVGLLLRMCHPLEQKLTSFPHTQMGHHGPAGGRRLG